MDHTRERLARGMAALALVAAVLVFGGGTVHATPGGAVRAVSGQFVMDEHEEPESDETDESSQNDQSDDSEDNDDSDDSDSDEESDEPTDEPTDEPAGTTGSGFDDPGADGTVEMPTDDTAATEDDESDALTKPVGWALLAGGVIAAIVAYVIRRRI